MWQTKKNISWKKWEGKPLPNADRVSVSPSLN